MAETILPTQISPLRAATTAHGEFYVRWLGTAAAAVTEDVVCSTCTGVGFGPVVKCCSYFPFLPNFVVGALIVDGSPEIRERMRVAFGQGRITPLGLFAPAENKNPVCPFLDRRGGQCTIWQHRPGVCSSFFCRSTAGQAGADFWSANRERVNRFEWTLAHAALWRLGFTQDEIGTMNPTEEEADTAAPGRRNGRPSSAAAPWFEYRERENELYALAYERACGIDAQEMASLLGGDDARFAQAGVLDSPP